MPEVILFLVGLGALQVIPNVIPHPTGREIETVFLDESFLIPMILMIHIYEIVLIFGAVVFFTHVIQNKPYSKTLFNTGLIAFGTGAAALIGNALGGIIGALIGAVFYTILSALAVGLLLSYIEKRPIIEWLRHDFAFRIVMLVSALTLGIFMYVAITGYPQVFPLAALGIVGLQMGYQKTRSAPVSQPIYLEN